MAKSPILEIEEVGPTMADKTTPMNDMIVALEAACNSQATIDFSGGDVTLSWAQFARYLVFKSTGMGADRNLIVPLVTPTGALPAYRLFAVRNNSVSHNLTVKGVTGATVVLAPSTAALIQSDGVDLITYVVGGIGPVGPTGPAGGAISIRYAFDTGVTDADPGTGLLRLNNATQNLATAIYVDDVDGYGVDWYSVLSTLAASSSTNKGQIRLFKLTDPSKWIVFNLTAVITHVGPYVTFTVAAIGASSASPFSAADVLGFVFDRTGDTGVPVLSAINTWSARQHTPPVTLTDAATIAVDFALANNFTVTLGGNRTLGNPTNVVAGDSGQIVVRQDGTGGRVLTPAANWFPVGGVAPAGSTTPNAYDIYTYYAITASHISYGVMLDT